MTTEGMDKVPAAKDPAPGGNVPTMGIDATPGARRRRRVVLLICCLSLFMTWLDNAIVNVALPAIQRDLHASVAGLQWTVDAYLVVLASLLLASGAIGDRVGRRRMFLIGLSLFLAGSLACSLAPGLGWLIGFRALQAIGGSLLVPSTLSIITNTFLDPAERAKAIGVWSATFGISIASGPILGGLLVDGLGWRAVFWANIPVGAIAFLLARRLVPESRAGAARRVDSRGQILTIVTIAAATFGVIEGPSHGWSSPLILGVFALASVSLFAFLQVERRQDEPLLDLRFFSSASFSGAFAIASLSFFVFTGFLFLNTLYLQEVRGDSALWAGTLTLPATAVIALFALLGGQLVARFGPRPPLVAGGASMCAACLGLAFVTPTSSYWSIAWCYVALGIGIGLVSPAITNTAVSGMPRAQAGVASGAVSVARQLGNLLGVAVLGSVLATEFHAALASHLLPVVASPSSLAALERLPISSATFSAVHARGVLHALRGSYAVASRVAWLLAGAMAALETLIGAVVCGPRRGARRSVVQGAAVSAGPEDQALAASLAEGVGPTAG